MKRILITGKNSYIGTSLIKWLENKEKDFYIEELDVKGEKWKEYDFSPFDTVFHVAGIAHVSTDPNMEDLYYKVNRDLTIEVAKKAKNDDVSQFIFMSSMIVYGDATSEDVVITSETQPNPSNFYGESKLQAEQGIKELEDENFNVVILRPPMIYGKNSKGNYPKLSKLAQKTPMFPNINNKRSMLYIDNLCELIRLLIINEEAGTFFPQNKEYVKTSEMVRIISEEHGKKIRLTKLFNPILNRMFRINTVKKVFGNSVYDQTLSEYSKQNYRIRDLRESIEQTEL